MAISAISPVVIPPVFIQPLAQTPQLNVAQPFNAALANSLNGLGGAPAALQAASTQPQLINSLEQSLFSQWITSLQSPTAGTLGTTLDSVLAGSLGITGTTGAPSLPFDANNPQSLLFAARLVSLFNTVDLLGGDAGQSTQFGSLLDILA
jgi:hypothetical protein